MLFLLKSLSGRSPLLSLFYEVIPLRSLRLAFDSAPVHFTYSLFIMKEVKKVVNRDIAAKIYNINSAKLRNISHFEAIEGMKLMSIPEDVLASKKKYRGMT